jgi:hypothetical protein
MEEVRFCVSLVRDPCVVAEATGDLHLLRVEAGLHPERAARPALAGEAVAEGHHERVARDLQTKLAAVTGGFA